MKLHIALLGATVALGLPLAAAPAFAQQTQPAETAMSTQNANWVGKNFVEGETRNIDHQKGVMHVKAQGRNLILHFPPEVLNKVHMGQMVTVEMAFADLSNPQATQGKSGARPAMGGSSREQSEERNESEPGEHTMSRQMSGRNITPGYVGEHTMTGTVTEVNTTNGTMDLKTSEAVLHLRFPQDTLTGVQKGDRVAVYLALKHP